MNHDSYDPAYISGILRSVKTVALVGASSKETRPSHGVMKFLLGKGYDVIPVNPNYAGGKIHGRTVYVALKDIPVAIDMVDVFRNPDAAGTVVDEALMLDPKPQVIWMQLAVRNDAAAARAEAAGVKVVMNRCPAIEYGKLSGRERASAANPSPSLRSSEAAASRYDTVAKSLHWIIALLMIVLLFFGEELMETDEGIGTLLPSLHVSIGIAVLVLSVFRLLWRFVNPPPPLPPEMSALEKMASKAAHVFFYVLMIGLPLSGWLAFPEFLSDEPYTAGITIFGAFPVPAAPDLNLPMDDIHEWGSNAGIALLVLHVLASLKHHFINRDDVLRRMLPG
ncbi:MAG: CoA-binding protein [Rhizobiales bacterium]|nr:CoA-binding protein [Hyphomicrobiales bacterium]